MNPPRFRFAVAKSRGAFIRCASTAEPIKSTEKMSGKQKDPDVAKYEAQLKADNKAKYKAAAVQMVATSFLGTKAPAPAAPITYPSLSGSSMHVATAPAPAVGAVGARLEAIERNVHALMAMAAVLSDTMVETSSEAARPAVKAYIWTQYKKCVADPTFTMFEAPSSGASAPAPAPGSPAQPGAAAAAAPSSPATPTASYDDL